MMSLSRFLCLSLAIAFLATGCGKKETEAPQETSPVTTDASDVFDEFFQDEPSAPAPEPVRAPMAVEFAEDGRFVVQVSCVGSQRLADDVAAKLQARGWPAYVAQVENPTPELPGTYYRVRIGGFYGVTPARFFGENVLVAEGYDFWVDNRSNDNVGIEAYGLGGSAPASTGYGESSYGSGTGSDWGSTTTTTTTDWGSTSTESAPSTPAATESAPSTPAATKSAPSTPAATTTETGTEGGWGSDNWGSDW